MPSTEVPAFTIRAPPLAKLLPTVPSPTMPPLEHALGTNSTSWSPTEGLKAGNFPSASWTTDQKSPPRPQSVVLTAVS